MLYPRLSWTQLGNELRTGHLFLQDFRVLINYGPPSLHDINICKILVLDHLGENIPVPTMFCSTSSVCLPIHFLILLHTMFLFSSQILHDIIKGYCRHRPGNRYIERGDYQLLLTDSDSSQVIPLLEFSNVVSGSRLEMSIVLRQTTTSKNIKRCPRCFHFNSTVTATDGWIEWKVALTFYVNPEFNIVLCSRRFNCSALFRVLEDEGGQGVGEGDDWTDEGDIDGEITSPNSCVTSIVIFIQLS
jgi:hypothetical protein